jgi:hypothetical protein
MRHFERAPATSALPPISDVLPSRSKRRSGGIGQRRHAAKSGRQLDQDFLPLAVKVGGQHAHASRIAAEFTTPEPTISSVIARIGIVVVAFCAARIKAGPPV